MNDLVPLMVAVPLAGGFLLPLIPKTRPRLADAVANAVAAALLALAIMTLFLHQPLVYRVGGWGSNVGIVLVLDGLSAFMLLVVAVVTLAATLFSVNYMDRYTGRPKYYGLFLLMVAGMNGVIVTGDVFNLFVFLEIASIASYALVAFGTEREELEASFKYAILGSVASTMVLLAVAVLYAGLGTVNMGNLAERLAAVPGGVLANPACLFALMLFVAGLGLKAALVPFHAWLPDAHPSAPAPISAMLSGVLIKAIGVYALVRMVFNVFGMPPVMSSVLMVLGTLSMVVGVFLAIGQWDYKRLLAYHSISQIGYVMLGIGLGTPLGLLGGLFHLANHAIFKSLLFLTAGAVEYRTGTRRLDQMGGLAKRMPVTGAGSLVGSMSIAGVPPFNGFVSKLIIIVACVQAGRWGYAGWAVLVSVMTLASFMKVQRYGFFGALGERWADLKRAPALMGLAMTALAVLCLASTLLILPAPRAVVLDPARAVLESAGREAYVEAVLGEKTRGQEAVRTAGRVPDTHTERE